MKKCISPRILAAALALSIGVAAHSFAAPADGRPGPGGGWNMGGMPGHHMMTGKGMLRLHDELKLDEKQEALWKEAQQFSREHRQAMFERFRKHHGEIKSMVDQPGTDLRSVAKRMDDLHAEGLKDRGAVRERWLSVYDSLNPDQKEKVRLFFKDRMERMERAAHERRGPGKHVRPGGPAPRN